jgi:low affinity Fe/Cu permease
LSTERNRVRAGRNGHGPLPAAFARFATATARIVGRPWTFVLAVGVVLGWAAVGPLFGFSDTWQLVVNTGTTIVTFLMVFLIQNTQNRDSAAMQIKLDELIRALDGARTSMLDLEQLDEEELERFRSQYERLARRARRPSPSAKSAHSRAAVQD